MEKIKEEFGTYGGYNYRVCYGLKDGKMDYSIPHYEFHKYCKCGFCETRRISRKVTNNVTVTALDKSKFEEVVSYLQNWECDKRAVDNSCFSTAYVRI